MRQSGDAQIDRVARHWRPLLLLFWLAVAAYMVFERWGAIRGFALGDTDDNMRMMQVRAPADSAIAVSFLFKLFAGH